MKIVYDKNIISQAVNILHKDGQLFEVRIKAGGIFSGYFTDADTLIKNIDRLDLKRPGNVWMSVNTILPDCAAREQYNQFVYGAETLSENDMTAYRWLFLDFDPVRPSGISSTAAELSAAGAKADEVIDYLSGLGFPAPVKCLSGNGYHVLYRFDAGPDAKQILKDFIALVSDKFSDGVTDIDRSVYTISHTCKLYGTKACKGSDTEDRPHRLSNIVSVPDDIIGVSVDDLRRVIDLLRPPKKTPSASERQTSAMATYFVPESSYCYRSINTAGKDDFSAEAALEALDYIPCDDYNDWIAGGYMIKAAGFDVSVFDRWSATSAAYDGKDIAVKWASFDGPRDEQTGINNIVLRAIRNGYTRPSTEKAELLRKHNADNRTKGSANQTIGSDQTDDSKTDIEDRKRQYIVEHNVASLMSVFASYIEENKNNRPIPTGFKILDHSIGGGLLNNSYMIGANTSAGKTTFALQMAYNIAASGNDVLYFSLEMGYENIIARGISLVSFADASESEREKAIADTSKEDVLPRTENDILISSRYKYYTSEQQQHLQTSVAKYTDAVKNHLNIYEPDDRGFSAERITAIVDSYIRTTGNTHPVVIIDYLQIMTADEDFSKKFRPAEKERIDHNVMMLYRLKKRFKIPVVIISSFARSQYTAVTTESSYKGSGEIEYTADCCITLEYDVDKTDDTSATKKAYKAAKHADVRQIVLTLQKNRGAKIGVEIKYDYYAAYNYFAEAGEKENVPDTTKEDPIKPIYERYKKGKGNRVDLRNEIILDYIRIKKRTSIITVKDMCDVLNITRQQFKSMIADLGGLVVSDDGKYVLIEDIAADEAPAEEKAPGVYNAYLADETLTDDDLPF